MPLTVETLSYGPKDNKSFETMGLISRGLLRRGLINRGIFTSGDEVQEKG